MYVQDKVEGDHRELGKEIYGDKGRGEGEANRIDGTHRGGALFVESEGICKGEQGQIKRE